MFWFVCLFGPAAQSDACVLCKQLLYDTFSAFGVIAQTPKIMRDPDTGVSRGFGFVSYDSFEASDAAIEAMNGQFLCNRSVCAGVPGKSTIRIHEGP